MTEVLIKRGNLETDRHAQGVGGEDNVKTQGECQVKVGGWERESTSQGPKDCCKPPGAGPEG